MIKKRVGFIAIVLINIILIGLTTAYYYLQKHDYYYTMELHNWILKVFQKDVPLFTIIHRKDLQIILLGITFSAIYLFVIRYMKNGKWRKALAVVMGIVYSVQIFFTDTWMNYRSFSYRFRDISDLKFSEFAILSIWGNAVSKYGFLILLIYFGFMCTALLLLDMRRTYIVEGKLFEDDDTEDEDIQQKFSEEMNKSSKKTKNRFDILDYDEDDKGALRIIELYANEAIGYKGVVDYIETLPPNDIKGLRSLLMIEDIIAGLHPVIEAAVRKAKNTKYRKLIEKLGLDSPKDKGSQTDSNVINHDFEKKDE